ncbi:MAG TPA: HEPN domain-containing protein [Gemmataceae bacterium]|nr:HEPN domain-containing protein [Gemmataceae bacterium]
MKKSTTEWVRKAEADYVAARMCSRDAKPLHDVVCFHCQQCAEKYLKALMEELGLSIPKTHDLDNLLTLLLPHHSSLRSLRRGLVFLTDFAVDTRYPGNNASKRQAGAALRWNDRVRTAARNLLGIRSRRSRRKKSP